MVAQVVRHLLFSCNSVLFNFYLTFILMYLRWYSHCTLLQCNVLYCTVCVVSMYSNMIWDIMMGRNAVATSLMSHFYMYRFQYGKCWNDRYSRNQHSIFGFTTPWWPPSSGTAYPAHSTLHVLFCSCSCPALTHYNLSPLPFPFILVEPLFRSSPSPIPIPIPLTAELLTLLSFFDVIHAA